jgi:hypothetical protein
MTAQTVSRAEAQSWVDDAVSKHQEQYRQLFEEHQRVLGQRDKYKHALERLCERGRCPIAEEALGI